VLVTSGLAERVEQQPTPLRPASGVVPVRAPAPSGQPSGRAFTALTEVWPGQEQELSTYLTKLGTSINTTADIAFSRLERVHFFRWVIVRDTASKPWLAFESNYDGTLEEHLDELVRFGATGLHAIYRHCVGYPLGRASPLEHPAAEVVVAFLRKQAIEHAAFHVGAHGYSAERIRREAQTRDAVQAFLDQQRSSSAGLPPEPDVIYDRIIDHLAARGWLADVMRKAPEPEAARTAPWLLRVAPVLLLLLPFAGPLYVLLWLRERSDAYDDVIDELPGIRELAEREDFQVQNQLTHVVDLKPGIFRQQALRLVLWVIDLLARYQFNQGALGGITTIHFARWVVIDGGKRLLFFSNYDGSWESYLGDFIDKAAAGLTAIWSNTSGFPRTANLVQQGATDEERFKSWTRAHQIPTQFWYSAYPELTMLNIQQNARVCAGLAERPPTPEALAAWLQTL